MPNLFKKDAVPKLYNGTLWIGYIQVTDYMILKMKLKLIIKLKSKIKLQIRYIVNKDWIHYELQFGNGWKHEHHENIA